MPSPRDGVRATRSTRARPSDDDLMDAAVVVFAGRGFTATTMNDIAERSNSTKPTLYAHFGDKETLYARVVEREADTCKAMLFAAYADSAGGDLVQQVHADTRALFDYAEAHPDGFAVLLGHDVTLAASTTREHLLSQITVNLAQRVHDYVSAANGSEPGIPTGAEHQVAAMLVGVTLSAARHALTRASSLDAACELASSFSTSALEGLVALGYGLSTDAPVTRSAQTLG